MQRFPRLPRSASRLLGDGRPPVCHPGGPLGDRRAPGVGLGLGTLGDTADTGLWSSRFSQVTEAARGRGAPPRWGPTMLGPPHHAVAPPGWGPTTMLWPHNHARAPPPRWGPTTTLGPHHHAGAPPPHIAEVWSWTTKMEGVNHHYGTSDHTTNPPNRSPGRCVRGASRDVAWPRSYRAAGQLGRELRTRPGGAAARDTQLGAGWWNRTHLHLTYALNVRCIYS